MSATVPSFNTLSPPLAAALPAPAADAAGATALPDLAFQLLIAELGTLPLDGVQPAPQPAGNPVAATADESHGPRKLTGDADDESLIEALAALCAWQLPVAVPVLASGTPAGADAVTTAAPPTAELSVQAAGAAAVDTVDAPSMQVNVIAPQPQKRLAAEVNVPAIQLAGSDAPAVRHQGGNLPAAPESASTAERLEAVADTIAAPIRAKSNSASGDRAPTVTDAVANGNLLMRTPAINTTATRTVPVPVHDARWPDAVATQIRWAINDGVQSATLKLVPENLGPVELHIELKDNQVNVNFGSSHADTRQALQDSLPRLREVLAGAGIALGQANVQQDSGRTSQSAGNTARGSRDDVIEPAVVHTRVALGLIDEYA